MRTGVSSAFAGGKKKQRRGLTIARDDVASEESRCAKDGHGEARHRRAPSGPVRDRVLNRALLRRQLRARRRRRARSAHLLKKSPCNSNFRARFLQNRSADLVRAPVRALSTNVTCAAAAVAADAARDPNPRFGPLAHDRRISLKSRSIASASPPLPTPSPPPPTLSLPTPARCARGLLLLLLLLPSSSPFPPVPMRAAIVVFLSTR